VVKEDTMLTSQIFIQLIIILIVVQVFGYLCQFIGQPRVIGEVLAGLALGPTLLGAVVPRVEATVFTGSTLPTLQTLGDIGLVLYMFSLGTHMDTHAMLKHGRKATVVSLSGVLLPLTMGAVLAFFLYPEFAGPKANRLSFMLLVGTAMAITAFPVLARLLEERGMLDTKIGALALLCAAIDDVVGWCLLALLIAIIHATGVASVAMTIVYLALFIAVMLVVVRPLLLLADQYIKSKPALMTLSMILLLLSASATNAMGVHPVFGAFMMGTILPRRTSLWLLCMVVLIIACLSKILGGSLSLKLFSASWKDSLTLGTLMNTRGLVELIVLNIGLDLGMISPTFFAMLVIMAVVTTMMAPPLLSFLGYRQKNMKVQASFDAEDSLKTRGVGLNEQA
jgi:Kef-type K+ transport system membrane component KefB